MIVTHPLFPHGGGTPGFILDVSVTIAWMVPAVRDWYTTQILGKLPKIKPVVPMSWTAHVADGLLRIEHSGIITPTQTAAKPATLRGYPILFDDETDACAWSDILDLARTHSLTVFDAAYLELSLRLNLPLATIDANLTRAAASTGATIFPP